MSKQPLTSRPTWTLAFAIAALFAVLAIPVARAGSMEATTLASSLILATFLAILSAIDFKTFRLPDIGTLPLIALGIAFTYFLNWEPNAIYKAVAALGAFGAFWLLDLAYFILRQRTGLGLGDAKLFAAAGAWLGVGALPSVLLYGSITAVLYAIVFQASGKGVRADTAIPFGPFLALGFWLVWLYGSIT